MDMTDEIQKELIEHYDKLAETRGSLSDLNDLLFDIAECFETVADDIAHWGSYADPYFQKKYGLDADIERYKNKAKEMRDKIGK